MSKTILKHSVGVHVTDRGPYIVTYTGKKFFPMSIRAGDICIEDIAHALSNQCRFAGHTEWFYSVAQHSILVSMVLSGMLKKPELALKGLLHDASEAYLVDVPRPIKRMADFTVYRSIEKALTGVIYSKYGIGNTSQEDIEEADNLLLATEARDLMSNPQWANEMPKLRIKIPRWTPEHAEKMYLKKFKELYV